MLTRVALAQRQLARTPRFHKPIRPIKPAVFQPRFYCEFPKPTLAEVTRRVIEVVQAFDKVDASRVTEKSTFRELDLDSLDSVEVVLAIEEEFVIEIPDDQAEKILSIEDVVNYISTHPHAK